METTLLGILTLKKQETRPSKDFEAQHKESWNSSRAKRERGRERGRLIEWESGRVSERQENLGIVKMSKSQLSSLSKGYD